MAATEDELSKGLFDDFQDFQYNVPGAGGSTEANEYVAEKLAHTIYEAIKEGASISFRGKMACSEINALDDKRNGDIFVVTDSGILVGSEELSVNANTAVIWNGEKFTEFISIDLSGYYTKEETDANIGVERTRAESVESSIMESVANKEDKGVAESLLTSHVEDTNPHQQYALAEDLSEKQDKLTFDSIPNENSSNPVTSSGIKTYVDSAVGGVMKYRGSVNVSYINSLQSPANGDVYNIYDSGTITNGEGNQPMGVSAGDNVAWVDDPISGTSYWDKLSSSLDLSGKMDTTCGNATGDAIGALIMKADTSPNVNDIAAQGSSFYIGVGHLSTNKRGKLSFSKLIDWVKLLLGIKASSGDTGKFLNEKGSFTSVPADSSKLNINADNATSSSATNKDSAINNLFNTAESWRTPEDDESILVQGAAGTDWENRVGKYSLTRVYSWLKAKLDTAYSTVFSPLSHSHMSLDFRQFGNLNNNTTGQYGWKLGTLNSASYGTNYTAIVKMTCDYDTAGKFGTENFLLSISQTKANKLHISCFLLGSAQFTGSCRNGSSMNTQPMNMSIRVGYKKRYTDSKYYWDIYIFPITCESSPSYITDTTLRLYAARFTSNRDSFEYDGSVVTDSPGSVTDDYWDSTVGIFSYPRGSVGTSNRPCYADSNGRLTQGNLIIAPGSHSTITLDFSGTVGSNTDTVYFV